MLVVYRIASALFVPCRVVGLKLCHSLWLSFLQRSFHGAWSWVSFQGAFHLYSSLLYQWHSPHITLRCCQAQLTTLQNFQRDTNKGVTVFVVKQYCTQHDISISGNMFLKFLSAWIGKVNRYQYVQVGPFFVCGQKVTLYIIILTHSPHGNISVKLTSSVVALPSVTRTVSIPNTRFCFKTLPTFLRHAY